MKLDELKVIVTGAASGLGKCFATELARGGAKVMACDVDSDGLEKLAAEVEGVHTQFCDVSREDSVKALVQATVEKLGGLNGLINNAGIFRDALLISRDRDTGEVSTMSLSQWQMVIDVDLRGPFLCTREVAAYMVRSGTTPGVIVNISSVSRHGNRGQTNYSAAKAGLVADTKLWAEELSRYGIRVGAVAPGFIQTPILEAMRPEMLQKLLKGVPLGRAGTPQEIWSAVRFIVECDYFTGRCIDVDGGLSI